MLSRGNPLQRHTQLGAKATEGTKQSKLIHSMLKLPNCIVILHHLHTIRLRFAFLNNYLSGRPDVARTRESCWRPPAWAPTKKRPSGPATAVILMDVCWCLFMKAFSKSAATRRLTWQPSTHPGTKGNQRQFPPYIGAVPVPVKETVHLRKIRIF